MSQLILNNFIPGTVDWSSDGQKFITKYASDNNGGGSVFYRNASGNFDRVTDISGTFGWLNNNQIISNTNNTTIITTITGDGTSIQKVLDAIIFKDTGTIKNVTDNCICIFNPNTGSVRKLVLADDYRIILNSTIGSCSSWERTVTASGAHYMTDSHPSNTLVYPRQYTGYVCNYSDNKLHVYQVASGSKIVSLNKNNIYFYDTEDASSEASDFLINKVAYNSTGRFVGTMPNNGAITYTPTTTQQNIADGYHKGSIIQAVDNTIDENIIADNIKKDVTILGITGTYEPTGGDATSDANIQAKYLLEGYSVVSDGKVVNGTMKDYGSKTFTPTSETIEIPEGHYDSISIPAINAANCDGYAECENAILNI